MRLNSPSVSTNCVDPLFSPHLRTGKRTISLMGDFPPPLLLASKNIRPRRHSATEQTHRKRHITFQGSCFQNKTRSLASLTLIQLDLGLPSSHLHSVHASNDLTQNNLTMQFFFICTHISSLSNAGKAGSSSTSSAELHIILARAQNSLFLIRLCVLEEKFIKDKIVKYIYIYITLKEVKNKTKSH